MPERTVLIALIIAILIAVSGYVSNHVWDNPPDGTELID